MAWATGVFAVILLVGFHVGWLSALPVPVLMMLILTVPIVLALALAISVYFEH
jgi:hypothetical protein